ncbi:hypothetical protein AYO41_00990 [Verrucomicrobia bacterium SCGC AG-212-E04]|jgi:hypothetical protein|nr:hypothetical protein AYO41_00990 [Verrucomicrobia bacterium SCGC AG-212-E04]
MSELESRYDIFEPGDLTALVCVEQPDPQQKIVQHLTSMDYKVHTGLFAEDVSLKIRTHPYDVVFIDENFGGLPVSQNPVLAEVIQLPTSQRRNQFIILIGNSVMTNDEMSAFIFSVDLVFNVGDLANLKPVLRRGVTRQREFYHAFKDNLKTMGMA